MGRQRGKDVDMRRRRRQRVDFIDQRLLVGVLRVRRQAVLPDGGGAGDERQRDGHTGRYGERFDVSGVGAHTVIVRVGKPLDKQTVPADKDAVQIGFAEDAFGCGLQRNPCVPCKKLIGDIRLGAGHKFAGKEG